MPTRCSMVAAADRRRRSSRSWRASSARFSARRSRIWGGTGKFSAHAPHPALSPEGGGLEAALDLGLLARLAHLVDPLSKVLAALFAPVGIEEVGRRGGKAHPHHQAGQPESHEHHIENEDAKRQYSAILPPNKKRGRLGAPCNFADRYGDVVKPKMSELPKVGAQSCCGAGLVPTGGMRSDWRPASILGQSAAARVSL